MTTNTKMKMTTNTKSEDEHEDEHESDDEENDCEDDEENNCEDDEQNNCQDDSEVTDNEHNNMAMGGAMKLVDPSAATNVVIASGDWTSPETWEAGLIPVDGSRVHIPEDFTVTVNSVVTDQIKTIGVAGTLRFATNVDTELRVDTLVTMQSGTLEIGTVQTPVAADVIARLTIADDGPIDMVWDPSLLSRGAVLHGRTLIHGAAKLPFSPVAKFPVAGDTSVQLHTQPNGWRVGDTIVIAGTDSNDPKSDETRVITSIDGKLVRFTQPLIRTHAAPKPDLEVHVANLTRNVRVSSENSELSRRGHFMVMHTNDAAIHYAWFDDLGRSDKALGYDDFEFPELDPRLDPIPLGGNNVRGRYSVHFHKGGTNRTSSPAVVNGSVVTDDPGWAYVNHSSHVEFTNNVSHNIVGAAYYTEAGDEIGAFIGNIALRTVNPNMPLLGGEEIDPDARENRQDYGFQGDGMWLHGPNVRIEDNVISGASGHAYIWWPEGLLEVTATGSTAKIFHDTANVPNGELIGPPGTPMQIMDVPVGSFVRNDAYSTTKGVQIYYLHTEFFGDGLHSEDGTIDPPASYDAQLRSTFSDSTLWNIDQVAFAAPYANRITTERLRIVGDGDPKSIGIDLGHFRNDIGIVLDSPSVEGFGIGARITTVGEVKLNGGTFVGNGTNIQYIIPNEDGGGKIVTK